MCTTEPREKLPQRNQNLDSWLKAGGKCINFTLFSSQIPHHWHKSHAFNFSIFDVQMVFYDGSEDVQRRVLIGNFWSHTKSMCSDGSAVMMWMFVRGLLSMITNKVKIVRHNYNPCQWCGSAQFQLKNSKKSGIVILRNPHV